MFTDRVVVQVAAGKGGNGIIAWRREKYIPKGGPTGGNGGMGGSVSVVADSQFFTLDWYRNRKILKAENGRPGGPNLQQGRRGEHLELKVPCGTLIKNAETGELIADLTKEGEKIILCKGGKGGRGNDSFKTSTNRAPHFQTDGKPGEALTVEFELKLIADVGLVGFPNAGKSTLMRALTRVNVKIAAYPFTTLHPNLGFFTRKSGERLFVADIPGIISGASQNRGLGFEFLRHIERTRVLIIMLDASGIDGRTPWDDFRVLKNEIKAYNPEILQKPILVVLNKIDADESAENIKLFKRKVRGVKPLLLSAITGEGVDTLIEQLESAL